MNKFVKTMSAAAVATLASTAAFAVTAPVDRGVNISLTPSSYTLVEDVAAGNVYVYEFTASEALRVVTTLNFGATGTNNGADITALQVGLNGDHSNLETIFTSPGGSDGSSRFNGFTLAAGEKFTFGIDNTSGGQEVGTTLSFTTAAVPLPAGALLLLSALAGGGMVARRKKTKA